MADEQTVTIDGHEYNLGDLSEAARNQITNMRVCDQKITQLQAELTIVRTARAAYANALKGALPATADGDTSIDLTAPDGGALQ